MIGAAAAWLARLTGGPILRKELYGLSRRWHGYAFRALYLVVLAFTLWATWRSVSFLLEYSYSALAEMSRAIFRSLAWGQFAMLQVAAVVFSCDQISREVRQKTLGVLALTPLRPHEVVLGKWYSSLGFVVLVLATGAPVLAICVYMGGATAVELVLAVTLTLSACALVSALAIAVSAHVRSAYASLVLSGLAALAYNLAPFIVALFLYATLPVDRGSEEASAYVNPAYALTKALEGSEFAADDVAASLTSAGVSLALSALLLFHAANRLRTLPLREPREPALRRTMRGLDRFFERRNLGGIQVLRDRPGVPDGSPLLWKELHGRAVGKLRYAVRVFILLFAPFALFLSCWPDTLLDEETLLTFAGIYLGVACLMAALQGAGSFSREKEHRSWDMLLVTPVPPHDFVRAKLLGAAASLAPPLITLAVLFVCACVVDREAIGDWARLGAAASAFLAFLLVLGAYFSLRLSTPQRAFLTTLAIGGGIVVLLPFALVLLMASLPRGGFERDFIPTLIAVTNPFWYITGDETSELGWLITLYGAATIFLAFQMVARFDAYTKRAA